MEDILKTLKAIQADQTNLAAAIEALDNRVNMISVTQQLKGDVTKKGFPYSDNPSNVVQPAAAQKIEEQPATEVPRSTAITSRIILTTYPAQAGIEPILMKWGEYDAAKRGPVVVSRSHSTIRRRNGKSCSAFKREDLIKKNC